MITKRYKRVLPEPRKPTQEELHRYLAMLAESGQLHHYDFGGGAGKGMLVTGLVLVLIAVGMFLWGAIL